MPVIIQTGDAGVIQMREGLESGARYYLTKPFHPEILTAILHSAAKECDIHDELLGQMNTGYSRLINLMDMGEFTLRTHEEARMLAATLAQAAIYPEFVVLGFLTELLYNAIEHGNLTIGSETKRKCLLANNFSAEVISRMNDPLYSKRVVHVRMDKLPTGLHVAIKDEGIGFNWRRYIFNDNGPEQHNDLNGRGIAKAMIMLDDIRYVGEGNEVHCQIGKPAYLSDAPDIKKPVVHS